MTRRGLSSRLCLRAQSLGRTDVVSGRGRTDLRAQAHDEQRPEARMRPSIRLQQVLAQSTSFVGPVSDKEKKFRQFWSLRLNRLRDGAAETMLLDAHLPSGSQIFALYTQPLASDFPGIE